jgi:NACalpha-BTF3-like transcription factor
MGRHNKNQSKKLTTSYLIDKYLKNEKKKETTRRLNHQEAQRRYMAKKTKETEAMVESPKVITIHATQKTTYQAVPNV